MRAGLTGFSELPFFDNYHEPVIGAAVPGLDFKLKRVARLVRMLSAALKTMVEQQPQAGSPRVPLVVGLAEPGRPDGAADLASSLIPTLRDEFQGIFHPRFSQTLSRGHVATFEGLRLAQQLLQDPEVTACLVAAVDSNISANMALWLDGQGRLKTEANSNGLIPGEAAGALLVQRTAPTDGVALKVTGLGFATEKVHVLSDEPFLGLGLAEATRQALSEAGRKLNEMDFRLSDVTGESYGFKEQSLTLSRVLRQGPSALPLWHCADSIGDVGAASGLCEIVRAYEAWHKNYAPGSRAIAFTSSLPGERAVAVLERHGLPPGAD